LQLPCHDEVMRFPLLWTSGATPSAAEIEQGRKLLRLSAVSVKLTGIIYYSVHSTTSGAKLHSSCRRGSTSRIHANNPRCRCVSVSTAGVAVSTHLQENTEKFPYILSCTVQTLEISATDLSLSQDGFNGWLMQITRLQYFPLVVT
jgi:hypothetical protein